MQIAYLYFFLGFPAFFEQDVKHLTPNIQVIVERCSFPKNPKTFTPENPFQIGDTVLIQTPKAVDFYFARVLNIQE
jgi:hypothetical protein